MAPIYLAQKSSNPNSGPNILKARGIAGYIPSTLSSLATVGIPHAHEIAFDGYYRNVDAFIAATCTKERVWCDAQGYTNNFRSTRPLNFGSVDIAYVPKVPAQPVQEEMFKTRISASSTNRTGKTLVYTIKNPTDDTLKGLIATCNESFSSGPDAVTPIGYRAFLFIRDVISEFLATHTYAAFSEQDLSKEGSATLSALVSAKRDNPGSMYSVTKKSRWEYAGCNPDKELLHADMLGDEEPDDEELADKWGKKVDKNHNGILITNVRSAVLKAKPSPSVPTNNFGPATSVPQMPGLAFPYIAGMNTPDPLIFKTTVATFFLRLLGTDTAKIQQSYVSLRRGFNSLSTTEIGKVLAHVLVGIKLAMESQARLYVIFDAEYRGFCLLGGGFTIVDGAQGMVPLEPELLRKDLACFNPHLLGLDGIVEALNELMQKGCVVRDDIFQVEDVDTEVKLIDALASISIGEDVDVKDTEVKLNRFLKFVCFDPETQYTRIDPQSISELITSLETHLAGGIVPIRSCKFSTWDAPYKNAVFRILGRFGTEAPSPWNASGSEISILPGTNIQTTHDAEEGSSTKRRKLLSESDLVNKPSSLIFAPKPVIVAWKDWEKVFEKKCVKMDMKERARQYRCCEVKADKMVLEIWKGLVGIGELAKDKVEKKKNDKGKGKARETAEMKSIDDLLAFF